MDGAMAMDCDGRCNRATAMAAMGLDVDAAMAMKMTSIN